jgi:hypothetical protein
MLSLHSADAASLCSRQRVCVCSPATAAALSCFRAQESCNQSACTLASPCARTSRPGWSKQVRVCVVLCAGPPQPGGGFLALQLCLSHVCGLGAQAVRRAGSRRSIILPAGALEPLRVFLFACALVLVHDLHAGLGCLLERARPPPSFQHGTRAFVSLSFASACTCGVLGRCYCAEVRAVWPVMRCALGADARPRVCAAPAPAPAPAPALAAAIAAAAARGDAAPGGLAETQAVSHTPLDSASGRCEACDLASPGHVGVGVACAGLAAAHVTRACARAAGATAPTVCGASRAAARPR